MHVRPPFMIAESRDRRLGPRSTVPVRQKIKRYFGKNNGAEIQYKCSVITKSIISYQILNFPVSKKNKKTLTSVAYKKIPQFTDYKSFLPFEICVYSHV